MCSRETSTAEHSSEEDKANIVEKSEVHVDEEKIKVQADAKEASEIAEPLTNLELDLFEKSIENCDKKGIKRIKYRLLREFVREDYAVSRETFMQV